MKKFQSVAISALKLQEVVAQGKYQLAGRTEASTRATMWMGPTAFCLLTLLAVPSATLHAQDTDRRLVIVSIDGLMATTLRTADQSGLQIPNLLEMRKGGSVSQGLVGVFPTVTYPSHTTMMTGRLPAEHGIPGNTIFDPEHKSPGAWHSFSEEIRTPALWDAARAAGLKTGGVAWPVSIGAAIDKNIPELYPLRSEDRLMMLRVFSSPGLYAEFEKASGRVSIGPEKDDLVRAKQAAFILRTIKPHLMLVHLADLDHDQHSFGPGSAEAKSALEAIDGMLGTLRQAVKDAGTADSTRWLIVSDHGFWPVSKVFNADAFLASFGLGSSDANPEAWRVAAYNNGGSIAFFAKNPNDGEAQSTIRGALQTLRGDSRWGIEAIVDRAELDKRKAFPGAFVAISMMRGFAGGNAKSGAWVTTSSSTRGAHGFLPGPPELDCTFVAFGPGIAAGELPKGELVDVARTAAALLGITMPTAGGRNLLEGRK